LSCLFTNISDLGSPISLSSGDLHSQSPHHTSHPVIYLCLTADLEVRRSGTAERLNSKHLVVEVASREAIVLPSSEVVSNSNSPAVALVLADREVLAESAGALDGRLVDLSVLADLVGRAVAGDAADGLGAAD
jgi:hypothetical protein